MTTTPSELNLIIKLEVIYITDFVLFLYYVILFS